MGTRWYNLRMEINHSKGVVNSEGRISRAELNRRKEARATREAAARLAKVRNLPGRAPGTGPRIVDPKSL